MSEQSRLDREAIETAYALEQLVAAGAGLVDLENPYRTFDTPTDKITLSLWRPPTSLNGRGRDSGCRCASE